jgi:hypothetical protein
MGRRHKKAEDKFVRRGITLPGQLDEDFSEWCKENKIPISTSIQELIQMRLEGVA